MKTDYEFASRRAAELELDELPEESTDGWQLGAAIRRDFAPGRYADLRETDRGWVLTLRGDAPEYIRDTLRRKAMREGPARKGRDVDNAGERPTAGGADSTGGGPSGS